MYVYEHIQDHDPCDADDLWQGAMMERGGAFLLQLFYKSQNAL